MVDIKRTEVESADEIARALDRADQVLGQGRVRYIHPGPTARRAHWWRGVTSTKTVLAREGGQPAEPLPGPVLRGITSP